MHLYRFSRTSWLPAGAMLVIALPVFRANAGARSALLPFPPPATPQGAIPNGLIGAGIGTFAETQLA